MKQSNIELSVGAFVLLGSRRYHWFAVQAGAGVAIGGSTYEVNARFTNIGGLKPGSQVFIAGVPVGSVEKIDLDSQYAAIVHLNVKQDVHLPSDTIASIKTSGLIGDKYIALAPGADEQKPASRRHDHRHRIRHGSGINHQPFRLRQRFVITFALSISAQITMRIDLFQSILKSTLVLFVLVPSRLQRRLC